MVVTGVTGFIGEQLLWKILTELPGDQSVGAGAAQGLGRARDRVAACCRQADLRRGRTRPAEGTALLESGSR